VSWAAKEFETLDLGDARLNRRAVLLAERLAQKPVASIPNACQNWSETVAAYRFLSNEDVNWDDVMQAHWQASEQRISQHPVVLCLQDTTELDFNGQQMAGLGPLSYEAQRDLYLHPTYVVTPDREPLGVTNAWTWAREFKSADGTRPGALESTRWIESYERVAEQALRLPQTRHVCVCDRESDIMVRLGRALAELPADLVFEADEWKAAFILNKKPVLKAVSELNTVLPLIAQLGGFLARKGDGEPGVESIWPGMQDVAVFVEGLRYARQSGGI
jgi:hypothetical protein